jgi:hypothetical protein
MSLAPSLASSATTVPVTPGSPYRSHQLLAFTTERQHQRFWCWVATAVSVAAFHNVKRAQCDVAQSVLRKEPRFAGVTLRCCAFAAPCDVQRSPELALQEVGHHASTDAGQPAFTTLDTEISTHRRPVVFRFRWNGFGAHACVIYGVGQDSVGNDFLSLGDPRPSNNPTHVNYAAVSRYGTGLTWTHTFWTMP